MSNQRLLLEDVEIFLLDVCSWTWAQASPSGPAPPARLGQQAAQVGEALYLFGGLVLRDGDAGVDKAGLRRGFEDQGSGEWGAFLFGGSGSSLARHAWQGASFGVAGTWNATHRFRQGSFRFYPPRILPLIALAWQSNELQARACILCLQKAAAFILPLVRGSNMGMSIQLKRQTHLKLKPLPSGAGRVHALPRGRAGGSPGARGVQRREGGAGERRGGFDSATQDSVFFFWSKVGKTGVSI